MRLALIGLASAALMLLGGCGSGTIESQLKPSRVIVFGDAFSDAGQTGAKYTVNDGSLNWAQVVAADYGFALTPAVSGGTAYATGNARVAISPDAAGNSATPTVQGQIDTFLASDSPAESDLVLLNGGFSDIIAEMAALQSSPAPNSDQMLNNVRQAARALAAQVKRLVAAGGKHVVVIGVYDMGRTPWANLIVNQPGLLTEASNAFNIALKIDLVDQNSSALKVLYVDGQAQLNNIFINPGAYGFDNAGVLSPACNSFDAGKGIGIGEGQVNSKLCTPATIVPGIDYGRYLFADAVYPTPVGHARFGDFAFSQIRRVW